MTLFQALLILTTFLCSLVAGFLFAFAVVIMPGIRSLDASGFIRAFQAIDRVIQNNQPLFMLAWAGSVLSLIATAVLGFWTVGGADRLLLVTAAVVYLVGVQLPTFAFNVPLNNALQKLDAGTISETTCQHARDEFEPKWNRWNAIRTGCASLTSILMLILIFRA